MDSVTITLTQVDNPIGQVCGIFYEIIGILSEYFLMYLLSDARMMEKLLAVHAVEEVS